MLKQSAVQANAAALCSAPSRYTMFSAGAVEYTVTSRPIHNERVPSPAFMTMRSMSAGAINASVGDSRNDMEVDGLRMILDGVSAAPAVRVLTAVLLLLATASAVSLRRLGGGEGLLLFRECCDDDDDRRKLRTLLLRTGVILRLLLMVSLEVSAPRAAAEDGDDASTGCVLGLFVVSLVSSALASLALVRAAGCCSCNAVCSKPVSFESVLLLLLALLLLPLLVAVVVSAAFVFALSDVASASVLLLLLVMPWPLALLPASFSQPP
mmetsp:Transcript_20135/g.57135  ORF Transcript_20135/g.57135 Transcript_20135/m.57135 type:complete len:267 (-) Transcript_20135:22-822(-)